MATQQNFFVYRPLLPESESRMRSLQEDYSSIPSFEPIENLQLPILTSQTWGSIYVEKLVSIIDKAPDVSKKSFDSEIIEAKLGPAVQDMTRRAINLVLSDGEDNHFLEEHKRFKAAGRRADKKLYVRPFTEPTITIGHLDSAHAISSLLDSAKALVGQTIRIGSTESNVGRVDAPVRSESIKKAPREIIYEPIQTIKPGGIPQGLLNSIRPRE